VTRMPSAILEKRGSIEFDERGHGPAVVLVPGSCSTGAAWRPVIEQWHGNFRCVTTSLLGYGDTAERRIGPESEISHESEIVESVIRRAASPVHLVGHSFGGLVALDVALRQQVPLLSLTIIEAPAAQLLRHAGEEQHYQAFRKMTAEYFAAFYRGDATAIETMIDFYGGAGTFASWPERVRDYALDTTEVNIRDWTNVYRFDLRPSRLATIDIPTLVLFGGKSHPAVQRANEIIGQCIAGATIVRVAGAAHFMISTNPGVVARSIAPHVMCAERLRNSAVA
jgi:pimeloyl-ACP methyl ester carboxylesterase